ncbi:hypothetical protein H7I42_12740 [Mycolicibacterium vanbaalenii PYR-1]|uniref:Uncharacterized protein n=1 Tax=Mycolicibacterium vanbaalenii (strain DSM 7251 / JCM 13017 / BCRC 16820 / KCTC 9966 / NRRL B-24157 / PYR-1) TaxID=350058 RepID=A1TF37_MYCVP|nr:MULTISPECIES: hypothetical protein [Mycolicibacterium]ABM15787.1 hypothetical protein Mvan_5015 [Mycolicibacterium vanbaalenii PYR-1]MCV7128140.1 hypothetical protein [Mycolicibacterium vanbaalenii PYR-1]QZT56145.1 hypothetical protein JN084_24980 [Mycolicibacterium austroafricanum]
MLRRVISAVAVVGVGLMAAANADAEPSPPPPPPVPPAANPLFPLAQNGSPVTVGGLPALPDLSGHTGNEFVLGQHAVPSAPGSAPAAPPHLNPFNNQYLLPQHLVPSAPGEGVLFGVEPGQENADISGIDYLKRLYESYRAGGLEGSLLGRRPVEQVGKPLEPNP